MSSLAVRVILPLSVLLASTVYGGVYSGTVDCSNPDSDDFCLQGTTIGGGAVNPFGITHPLGFTGSGGVLTLNVCVEPGMSNQRLVASTKWAIRTWNNLKPVTSQCFPLCPINEEGDPTPETTPYDATSAILHELGHCAMGLGHPDLEWDPPGGPDEREPSSFTMSYGGSASGVSAGPDGIPGSFDDSHDKSGGGIADSVHWFRRSDNNPVIIDDTVIDLGTYSRSVLSNIPAGHGWAANANRLVAESLGAPMTQSVMYSRATRGQRRLSLTADEVNMVKMARTGQDRMAGTMDDYSLVLQYVADCSNAGIKVRFLALGPNFALGGCAARIGYSFPQNPTLARHYSLVPTAGSTSLAVTLNESFDWKTYEEIFADGFETGDATGWSSTFPPIP